MEEKEKKLISLETDEGSGTITLQGRAKRCIALLYLTEIVGECECVGGRAGGKMLSDGKIITVVY